MARIVIAPDGFGGSLTAAQAAEAMAHGWARVRPDDELIRRPMSDGGEGLLEVLATPSDTWHRVEVADPLGRATDAELLVHRDGSVVIESARACGLALVPPQRRDPRLTTTYGVGQLLEAARGLGATRIIVGLGGSATTDGGAGALTALGFRLQVTDGSGLKVGGGDLGRIERIGLDWVADWRGIDVTLLADVATPLTRAAQDFAAQKGAGPTDVERLRAALERWADVVERDLLGWGEDHPGTGADRLRDRPASGAAGGLGFGLMAGLGAAARPGSEVVGELVGLDAALASADAVVTGEGRLDATTTAGKVVAHVAALARGRSLPVLGVVGQRGPGAPELDDLQVAAAGGPSAHPEADVTAAAARSAAAWGG